MLRKVNFGGSLPSPVLVLIAILSAQLGAILAKQLFTAVGYAGSISLSFTLAAGVLLLWRKPKLQYYSRQVRGLITLMGLVLAGMYLCFYGAIEKIPFGVAIVLQFIGPLGLSALSSCRRLDLLWVFLAGTGIMLLTPVGQPSTDWVGMGLALLAGLLLAKYITLVPQVGLYIPSQEGLALALTVSAVALLPIGISVSSELFASPQLLLIGVGVALFSAVVPFSLDAVVLRQTPVRTFGILLSLEPVIASLLGWILLGESLSNRAITGIALISLAAAGNSYVQKKLGSDYSTSKGA